MVMLESASGFRRLFALLLLLALPAPTFAQRARVFDLASPDDSLAVKVGLDTQIWYSVSRDGKEIVSHSPVSMTLSDGRVLGEQPRLKKQQTRTVQETIRPVAFFRSEIPNHFNELRLDLRDGYALVFRAYDDGAAYRFETSLKDRIRVASEEATFQFAADHDLFVIPVSSFNNSYEDLYRQEKISELAKSERYGLLPLLVVAGNGLRVGITESDLYDYPALYLIGDPAQPNTLTGVFPPYPLAEAPDGHMNFTSYVTKTADYIADTEGTRTFPWRVMIVAESDAALLGSDLVYRLASPPDPAMDFSWVTPGKVAWDWWHANLIRGVDFQSGINNETYEYYIDFAARNGIEYINLDEGWSDQYDLTKLNPQIDVKHIVAYGKERGVDVILWCVARVLEAQLIPALDQFQQWGVAGIKVDFMQRDDQPMVNFYERVAREAAERRIHVNFHGAYKPTGLSRAYPNVVNHEAVRGLEYNKFDSTGTTPAYATTLPFVRMLAGYMDYTPGAMTNAQAQDWRTNFRRPMSQGTRSQQLALYVVLFAPLQMLSDAPYRYEEEPEILDFLKSVPTTWDETAPLDGEVGKYAVVARRKGDVWYVGAINGEEARKVEVRLPFLDSGTHQAEIFRDGPNAAQLGEDYVREQKAISSEAPLMLDLAPGGGSVIVIRPGR